MKILLFIGSFLLIFIMGLFLVILFNKMKVQVNVNFHKKEKNLNLTLNIIKLNLFELNYDFITEELKLNLGNISIPVTESKSVGDIVTKTDQEEKIVKKIVRYFKKLKQKRKFIKLINNIENMSCGGEIEFGTGNAYTTGMILGGYNTFIYFLPQLQDLTIIPNFLTTTIEGKVEINLKFYLYRLLKGLFGIMTKGKLQTKG